jgi:uncharacterized protein (TIGR02145 family)
LANYQTVSTTFPMPAKAVTLEATFAEIPPELYAFNFTPTYDGGTVTVEVDGAAIASGDEVEEGADVTITAAPASGYSFGSWGGVTLTDNTALTATFPMPGEAVTLTATFEEVGVPEFITVGDLSWATRNVDAPGTFAANPESYGMLYQWGVAVGWVGPVCSPEDGASSWKGVSGWGDPTNSYQNIPWPTDANPCPTGYTVPTQAQWGSLVTAAQSIENKTINEIAGKVIITSAGELFFPYAGYVNGVNVPTGPPSNQGVGGKYWTSDFNLITGAPPAQGKAREIGSEKNFVEINNYRTYLMSVRCVK